MKFYWLKRNNFKFIKSKKFLEIHTRERIVKAYIELKVLLEIQYK